jgi:solute carrier family 35
MFIALRRCCMLCTIALERCLLGRVHKSEAVWSTGLMIVGAVLAAATDLNFNVAGYAAIGANNVMTALYLVMMKQPRLASVDSKAMLFYSAALSVPLLGLAALMVGEPAKVAAFPGAAAPGFAIVLALAGSMGVFINHATMVCTRVNGPLTTSVAGSAKNIVMTAIGMLAFNDFVYAPWNTAGLVVSAGGTVWYAASEYSGLRRRAKGAGGQQGSGGGDSDMKRPLLPRNV